MLRIHKSTSKKLPIVIGASICGAGALLGLYGLTYTPELSHAETVVYNPPIPQYHPNISDITYMQDMTEEVCQNSYENDTKQLIDKRDSKTYWVTKLKDGNCWMTQNLAYNGGGNVGKPATWDNDNTARKYYNPGLYVYSTPTSNNNSCGDYSSGLKDCTNKGWVDVTGWIASADSNYTKIVDTVNKIYDAHYLAGNYYSYAAATAGTAPSGAGEATSSICPTGWQLPENQASTAGTTVVKSYRNLLDNYGWSWNQGNDPFKYSNSLTGVKGGNTYDIRSNPLYFVYGGSVGSSFLGKAGSYGGYWSSTAYDGSNAFRMSFNTGIYPSYSNGRYGGNSVRCVARGEAVVRPGTPSVDNVEITVNPTINLDVADEVNVEKTETNPSAADLDVKVTSNQKYSVEISAEDSNLTSTTSEVKIPAKSGLLNTAENGWGIKLKDDTEFTALTSTLQTFYTASGAEIKTIPLTIGISTAPDIPNGEYSTDITITATQN